eukprot:scaffold3410_cov141-Cylindrotheca_fusiformis.AAC.21
MTAFRIGSSHRKVSENRVRSLLKEVRRNDCITQLYVCNIDFNTQGVLEGMTKLLVRDGRRFSCIKLLSCSGDHLSTILTMILDHASTGSLALSNISPEVQELLNESLRTNQSLTALRISGSAFLATCLDGLKYNCTLKELDLCESHLSEAAVDCLSQTLSSTAQQKSGLEVLKLESCDLGDSSMTHLMESLLDHKTLHTLDLSSNAASTKAISMVAKLIQQNRIKNLYINYLLLSEDLDQNVLLDAISSLESNTSLSVLDVSGNHFTDDAVQGLAQAICSNSTLKALNVSDCDIAESEIKTFAQYLPQFRGLKELNLAENEITEAAALALLEALKDNRLLQSLGPLEEKSYECTVLLEHYLDLNLAGRRAFQNDICLGVWPHLLARAVNANLSCGRNENAIFSLLKGPALFER